MGFEVWDSGLGVTARMMHDFAVMKWVTMSWISVGISCQ